MYLLFIRFDRAESLEQKGQHQEHQELFCDKTSLHVNLISSTQRVSAIGLEGQGRFTVLSESVNVRSMISGSMDV